MSDSKTGSKLVSFLKKYGRWILLGLGILAVTLLIRESGPDQVFAVIVRSAPWLPVIFLLEIAWISMDAVALSFLLRHRNVKIPLSAWLKSGAVAYGVMVLLPAGRAGGEVMRAAQLSKYVGIHSATAAAQLQGSTLLANTVISLPCCLAVMWTVGGQFPALVWLLILNGVATAVLGTGVLFATSRSAIGARLARWFSSMQPYAEALDEARPKQIFSGWAIFCTSLGRMIQALQYGIILLSIGGTLTVSSAFIAQGIHLVGAGLGEMVPNAVGITETAYRVFAPTLGFEHDFARAIAIALVARLTQYTLAAIALISGMRKASEIEEKKTE